jgi:hypothetical protein
MRVVFAIVLAFVVCLAVACSDEASPPASPTSPATPTVASATATNPPPTPTVATCPPVMDVACDTADWAKATLAGADPDGLFAYLLPHDYVCSGGVPEYGDICDGAGKGEHRQGFQISIHGSEGEMASESRMRFLFDTWLGAASEWRLVNIGCPASGSCARFIVVFARAGQPQVLYLAFQEVGHDVPNPLPPGSAKLTGFGVSGDNADELRNGRPTMTSLGETRFVAYGGKP